MCPSTTPDRVISGPNIIQVSTQLFLIDDWPKHVKRDGTVENNISWSVPGKGVVSECRIFHRQDRAWLWWWWWWWLTSAGRRWWWPGRRWWCWEVSCCGTAVLVPYKLVTTLTARPGSRSSQISNTLFIYNSHFHSPSCLPAGGPMWDQSRTRKCDHWTVPWPWPCSPELLTVDVAGEQIRLWLTGPGGAHNSPADRWRDLLEEKSDRDSHLAEN